MKENCSFGLPAGPWFLLPLIDNTEDSFFPFFLSLSFYMFLLD